MPVFLRTKKQLESISAANPFPAAAHERAEGPLQVVLLHRKPKTADVETVLALASDDDLLEVDGTELYWLPAHGTQESQASTWRPSTRRWAQMTLRTQGTISRV